MKTAYPPQKNGLEAPTSGIMRNDARRTVHLILNTYDKASSEQDVFSYRFHLIAIIHTFDELIHLTDNIFKYNPEDSFV